MRDLLKYVIAFVIGTVFGSFGNVLIYRPLAGLKLNEPRYSVCPSCGSRIRWYDNVPLMSYVLLKGKCRYCGKPISPRYPLVELVYGLVFLANVMIFPLDVAIALSAMFTVGLPAFFIDLKIMMLPDYTWIVTLASAAYLEIAYFGDEILFDVAAGLLTLMVMLLLKLRYRDGLGEGDIFLFPVYAFACGLFLMPYYMLASSFSGLVYGRTRKKEKLPFGPFILAWGYGIVFTRYLLLLR